MVQVPAAEHCFGMEDEVTGLNAASQLPFLSDGPSVLLTRWSGVIERARQRYAPETISKFNRNKFWERIRGHLDSPPYSQATCLAVARLFRARLVIESVGRLSDRISFTVIDVYRDIYQEMYRNSEPGLLLAPLELHYLTDDEERSVLSTVEELL